MAKNGHLNYAQLLAPLVEQFTNTVAAAVAKTARAEALREVTQLLTPGATDDYISAAASEIARIDAILPKRKTRPAGIKCYFPRCKHLAAPRFGMFCAALHKDLPKAEKEKYRRQHNGEAPEPTRKPSPRKLAAKPKTKAKTKPRKAPKKAAKRKAKAAAKPSKFIGKAAGAAVAAASPSA